MFRTNIRAITFAMCIGAVANIFDEPDAVI